MKTRIVKRTLTYGNDVLVSYVLQKKFLSVIWIDVYVRASELSSDFDDFDAKFPASFDTLKEAREFLNNMNKNSKLKINQEVIE